MNFWENPRIDEPVFSFLETDEEGTPVFFKVKDWLDVKEYTFKNEKGQEFTSMYLQTSEGLLRVDSKRLLKELQPFAIANEKRKLTIQRWCEGQDKRSTVYKVSLHSGTTSTKKK